MNKKLHSKVNITLFTKVLVLIMVFFFSQNQVIASKATETDVKSLFQVEKDNNITLNLKGATIKSILYEIQKQTKFNFVYKDDDFTGFPKKDLNVKEQSVGIVLEQLFSGTQFTYKIIGNNISIIKSEGNTNANRVDSQKSVIIKGKVLDKQRKAITGATLIIRGTAKGAISDDMGQFFVNGFIGDVVDISFTGMKPQEIIVSSGNELIITMEEDAMVVDDVVVTGIFKKSKESFTGAVTTITEKELKAFKGRNLLSTLRNIDPAFNIIENNQYGSDPNRLPEVQMRGTSSLPTVKDLQNDTKVSLNTPLIIMDGFEVSLSKMLDMNDNDVSTVTLLKDGSATAIYGSRGANGVIVIETKRPAAGKLRLSYNGSVNIEAPDLSDYDVLNAREKLQVELSGGLYNNPRPNFEILLRERYNSVLKDIERGVDTYWLDKPLRTGIGHKHNLRLEGGGEDGFRYAASAQYNDVKGVMRSSDRRTFTGGVNIMYSYKNLLFRNNLEVSIGESNESPYGNFSSYVKLNPYWRSTDDRGVTSKELEARNEFWNVPPQNPMYNSSLNSVNKNRNTDIINNFDVEWKPFEFLTLRSRIGLSKGNTRKDDFRPADHTDFNDYSETDLLKRGKYRYGTGNSFNYDWNVTASFSKTFNEKHMIYAGFDYNLAEKNSDDYMFTMEGFPQANINNLTAALQYEQNKRPTGSESVNRRIGLTGNFNYTYDSRYFVDAAYRMDGASQFGSSKRFAPFYSFGMGWNIHKEKFMGNVEWLDRLKVRGSYAVTGAVNFNAYQAMATYEYYMEDRYRQWFGAKLMGLENPDLSWQKTKKWNIGAEMGVLNNRLNVVVDFYSNRTTNLLSEMYLPLRNGFSSFTDNVGIVGNKGLEFSVNGYIIRNTAQGMIWNISASLIHEKNKIVEISEALKAANKEIEERGGTNPNFMYREGKSLRTIYVVKSLGIDPSTGKELYVDRKGDISYTWNANDKVDCGIAEPKFRGNINSMFTYKNLSFNLSFGYRLGGHQYNSTLVDRVENANLSYNVDRRVYQDRWVNPGDKTFFKDIKDRTTTQMSSRFVQKENTLECQSISVRYDLEQVWFKKNLGVENLSLGFSTDNLFRISSVKQERGIEYPFSRRFTFSIYATF